MKQQVQISRRSLIASVSTLAMVCVATPKLLTGAPFEPDGFIILNGWVLKRSEMA